MSIGCERTQRPMAGELHSVLASGTLAQSQMPFQVASDGEGCTPGTGAELLASSLPGTLVGPSRKVGVGGAQFGSHGLETGDPSPLAVHA